MKTVKYPENSDELRNILIQEDVKLEIYVLNVTMSLVGDVYSVSRMPTLEVLEMLQGVLEEKGICVEFKKSQEMSFYNGPNSNL